MITALRTFFRYLHLHRKGRRAARALQSAAGPQDQQHLQTIRDCTREMRQIRFGHLNKPQQN